MAATEFTSPVNRPRRRWRIVVGVFAVAIACGVGRVLWNKSTSATFAQQLAQTRPSDPDAQARSLVIGTWQDEYQGKRTMTLNQDGSGTMIVELTGWRAAFSAPRLKFNMKWSAQGGRLKKQTLSGEPEAQVKMILTTMGDHVDEPILELTADRLVLLDKDGSTKYTWTRVKK